MLKEKAVKTPILRVYINGTSLAKLACEIG